MLRQRIITAAILLPLFVAAVWYLPTAWFALLTGVIICLAAWEWSNLAGLEQYWLRACFVVFVACMLGVVFTLRPTIWSQLLIFMASVGWILVVMLIIAVEARLVLIPGSRLIKLLLGLLVLVPSWLSLILLQGGGSESRVLLLFIVVLIAGADIGAYFTGRRWGRRKLAPIISPGKTRAGLAGGMAVSLAVALGYVLIDNIQGIELLIFISLCLITVLFSAAGDLLESLMKRSVNFKDSGTLLPGHGGVLDRIDSLTAAIPVFVTGLLLWGMYS
ncbi:MAG: phosphatidate cytidylyltransferase [Gammaproteobacteria bacterium]